MSARRRDAARSRWGFAEGVVFVAGISTLGAEIAAARLIAPAFGASTVVWANTIAIVLVALAGGYWLGGRLADRHPHARALARTALLGAVMVALIPLLAIPLLSVDRGPLGEFSGSLLVQLVLVAPPVLVLGALSPWAIRLRMRSVAGRGRHHRPPLRARHGGRARRQLRRDARADPVGRDALDVPRLRARCWPSSPPRWHGPPSLPERRPRVGRPALARGAGRRPRGRASPRARCRCTRTRVTRTGTSRSTRRDIAAAVRALRDAAPASRSRFSTGLWITGGDVDARARADLGLDRGARPGLAEPERGGLARAGRRARRARDRDRGGRVDRAPTPRPACRARRPGAARARRAALGERRRGGRDGARDRRRARRAARPRRRGCITASAPRPGPCSTPPCRTATTSGSASRTC